MKIPFDPSAIIAKLLAAHNAQEPRPAPPIVTVGAGQKLVKVQRKSKGSAPIVESKTVADAPSVATAPISNLPAKGSIDAATFQDRLRNAGKRLNDAGRLVFRGADVEREDQKIAIAAFVGFDLSGAFGNQLDAARREAQRQINPPIALTAPYSRGSAPTVDGFISGLPHEQRRRVLDFLGRERLAAETMSQNVKLAEEAAEQGDETSQAVYLGLAAAEEERLQHLRDSLSDFGFPVD